MEYTGLSFGHDSRREQDCITRIGSPQLNTPQLNKSDRATPHRITPKLYPSPPVKRIQAEWRPSISGPRKTIQRRAGKVMRL
jgi:hypothetical protein